MQASFLIKAPKIGVWVLLDRIQILNLSPCLGVYDDDDRLMLRVMMLVPVVLREGAQRVGLRFEGGILL